MHVTGYADAPVARQIWVVASISLEVRPRASRKKRGDKGERRKPGKGGKSGRREPGHVWPAPRETNKVTAATPLGSPKSIRVR
jgi:hypothetical protein